MSALGHKRTFDKVRPMSALPPKADIQWSGMSTLPPKADSTITVFEVCGRKVATSVTEEYGHAWSRDTDPGDV